MSKRCFDLALSALGIIILCPLLCIIGLLVKLSDGGPVFFCQVRVGHRGRLFKIWKFRTMRVGADELGASVTRSADPRITRMGVFLRKLKLDELPQLFNVLAGEMSLVGPRPEVSKYVALYTPEQRRVLELIPGITDLASLEFRDEEGLLAAALDVERFYREFCIPRKIALNLRHASRASTWQDFKIILRTIVAVMTKSRPLVFGEQTRNKAQVIIRRNR